MAKSYFFMDYVYNLCKLVEDLTVSCIQLNRISFVFSVLMEVFFFQNAGYNY